MRFLKTPTIALSLAALAVAGCGGGDDDSTDSTAATVETTALSRAELISQGDAICAEVNAAVGSAASGEAETPDQTAQIADLYIGMVESIKRLGIPAEDEGYAEFIAAAEELSQVEGEAKLASRTRRQRGDRRSGDPDCSGARRVPERRRRVRLRRLRRRTQRTDPLRPGQRRRPGRRRRDRSRAGRTRRRSANRRSRTGRSRARNGWGRWRRRRRRRSGAGNRRRHWRRQLRRRRPRLTRFGAFVWGGMPVPLRRELSRARFARSSG